MLLKQIPLCYSSRKRQESEAYWAYIIGTYWLYLRPSLRVRQGLCVLSYGGDQSEGTPSGAEGFFAKKLPERQVVDPHPTQTCEAARKFLQQVRSGHSATCVRARNAVGRLG